MKTFIQFTEDAKKPLRSKEERMKRTRKSTGRATFGKDTPVSSVGTDTKVRRRTVVDLKTGRVIGPADPSDVRISGRYGTVSGGRGTRVGRSGRIIGS